MEYNTTREALFLSEYGRSVQKMVEHIITIEDKDTRTRMANAIINIMVQINPGVRDQADFKHKLWDQLHIISNFRLDVDAPYPPPSPEILESKPQKVPYSQKTYKYGHYGKNIEKIILQTAMLDDSPEKEVLVKSIANHLKKAFLTYNRDSVDDEVIYEHLKELSHGRLILTEETRLHPTNDLIAKPINKKKKFRPREGGQGVHFKKRKK